MGESAHALLLHRIHEVVRAAHLFEEFETAERFTLRVENGPYMPLVIESYPTPDALMGEKRRVLVAHYSTQQGQAYPDPELEMTDSGFPVRLRQTVLAIRQTTVLWRDPHTQRVLVNVAAKKDMAHVLRVWANNIKLQGFIVAAARIIPSGTSAPLVVAPPNGELHRSERGETEG